MHFTASPWVSLNKNSSRHNLLRMKKKNFYFRSRQSIPYSSVIGEYKSMNNSGSDNRLVRDNFDILKSTSNEPNSPLNRCIPRYQDEEFIDCQFSICGCNFRTTDLAQLNTHNEENMHRHMNVSVAEWNQMKYCPKLSEIVFFSPDDVVANHSDYVKRCEIHIALDK